MTMAWPTLIMVPGSLIKLGRRRGTAAAALTQEKGQKVNRVGCEKAMKVDLSSILVLWL